MIRNIPRRRAIKLAVLATALSASTAFACICSSGIILVKKFYDANANGIHDPTEPRLRDWPMTLGSASLGDIATLLTDSFGYAQFNGVIPGTDYTMFEAVPVEGNWFQSKPVDAGGDPINPQTGIVVTVGHTTQLSFGNYCTKGSGGKTPGFWSNKNGQATMLDGSPASLLPELNLLGSLNLVDANGVGFNPVDYPSFRTWLLDSNATNMAYKLSSHLAAMQLNVEAGFVSGNAIYAPFGGTVNELMALANASLGSDPYTPSGHPERAYQEQLKDYLDALNNGAGVVSPTPCKRTFTTTY
ncbi:hypothetical protein LYSHEL_19720 [Lysobacter helvus]|uniref:SD-repeat containing protein B domain-containing protein n=2 Tax=Lysobacteraceae TaxID=32033 RepID=A0ABM7Q6E5_9GAMM|nr:MULTISPECIES: hypothetical protein [Lysobacter]BCT92949.1 hypothetical protein LYSCAS_19730 [Lysobacter caseinilyticus]BCT96101.1 hypothetical protein LYSHEL_19720 [Lysobacter helvus]